LQKYFKNRNKTIIFITQGFYPMLTYQKYLPFGIICFGSGGIWSSATADTAIIIYTAVATRTAIANITAVGCTAGRSLRDCSPLGLSLRSCPSAGSTPSAELVSSYASPSFSCGCPSKACSYTRGSKTFGCHRLE
jgi:hypothetical protein